MLARIMKSQDNNAWLHVAIHAIMHDPAHAHWQTWIAINPYMFVVVNMVLSAIEIKKYDNTRFMNGDSKELQ